MPASGAELPADAANAASVLLFAKVIAAAEMEVACVASAAIRLAALKTGALPMAAMPIVPAVASAAMDLTKPVVEAKLTNPLP
eukprot:6214175-Pleurochrysis_carterae.AAC.2